MSTLKLSEVVQYSKCGEQLAVYPSVTEAAKALKVPYGCIAQVLDKSGRTYAGFVWRRMDHPYDGLLSTTPAGNVARQVTQYDLKGRKLQVFRSTREAGSRAGLSSSTISAVANGKLKTTGGFIWQYGEGPARLDIDAYFASTRQVIERSSKPVVQYTVDEEWVAEYPSIAAAARSEGLTVKQISGALHGKSQSAGGFRWR